MIRSVYKYDIPVSRVSSRAVSHTKKNKKRSGNKVKRCRGNDEGILNAKVEESAAIYYSKRMCARYLTMIPILGYSKILCTNSPK